ncbi:MAG: class I SAM-dependent methyltransferase [Bdellovibrionaceae bacterium]|nr:class I SAM-dependent methyltransferase [Pseudobdellovibrionaceae bacterium]
MSEHAQDDQRIPIFLQLGFRPEALPALRSYLDLLWSANEEMNLISRQMSKAELVDNHVIDCLLPLPLFPPGLKEVADFGSGGGLPGALYAIQFPGITWHLYEKSKKKREFLERCRSFAPNLRVHGEIPRDLPGIELVTARAFKPIDVILDISRNYHAAGGKYFLLKGRREKIDEELRLARGKFKNLQARIEPLSSPVLDVERHLVLL